MYICTDSFLSWNIPEEVNFFFVIIELYVFFFNTASSINCFPVHTRYTLIILSIKKKERLNEYFAFWLK